MLISKANSRGANDFSFRVMARTATAEKRLVCITHPAPGQIQGNQRKSDENILLISIAYANVNKNFRVNGWKIFLPPPERIPWKLDLGELEANLKKIGK